MPGSKVEQVCAAKRRHETTSVNPKNRKLVVTLIPVGLVCACLLEVRVMSRGSVVRMTRVRLAHLVCWWET